MGNLTTDRPQVELQFELEPQQQQKLTAMEFCVCIVAMNKFSSNYYFRQFCNKSTGEP